MPDDKKSGWKKSKTEIGKEFNQALADEIVSRMNAGENLQVICKEDHMPKVRSIANWRKQNKEFNKLFLEAYHSGRGIVCAKKVMGRPSLRTPEIEEEILHRLEDGEILAQICRLEHMPRQSTLYEWMAIDPILSGRVARARSFGANAIQAECLDIADDGRNDFYEKTGKNGETFVALDSENIQRSRLRIDTRKWIVGTINPALREGPQVKLNITTPEASIQMGEVGGDTEAKTPESAFEEYQKLVKGE